MTVLKREPVKYIRDFIKKEYNKALSCFICDSTKDLELHHIYSLSQLWREWCHNKNITTINSVEHIFELRELFQKQCRLNLSNDNLYTLCKIHHNRLHTIYGQRYDNNLVPKIERWLRIQREKHLKGEVLYGLAN